MAGIVVHRVVLPRAVAAVVEAEHEQAVTRQIGVPLACALAVFQQKPLHLRRCVEQEALVRIADGLQLVSPHGIEGLGLAEAQRITLVEGVAGRRARIVQIGSAGHDAPLGWVVARTAAALIVGVVEVGQPQHVAELMADGADAVEVGAVAGVAGQLGGAGVAAQIDIVFDDILPCVRVVDDAGVGPYQPAVVAAIVGARTGEDEVDHVHLPVAVAVVLAEVNQRVGSVDHVEHQLRCTVSAVGKILAAIHGHGAHHIELRREHAVGVVVEIITHGAREAAVARVVVAAVVLHVGHVVDDVGIVVARELAVAELHQDDQPAEVVVVILLRTVHATGLRLAAALHLALLTSLLAHGRSLIFAADGLQEGRLVGRAQVGIVGHLRRRRQLSALCPGIDVVAARVLHHGVAVGRRREVQIFVAMEAHTDVAAIRLLQAHCARMGWDGHGHRQVHQPHTDKQ